MEAGTRTVGKNEVLVLVNGSYQDCSDVLNNFILNNEKNKAFPDLSLDIKKSFYHEVFTRLSIPSTPPSVINLLLSSLRILSREVSTLDLVLTEDNIQTILKVSKLKPSEEYANCDDSETLEGLKVVFNMNFQSSHIRAKFIANGFLEYLVSTIESYTEVPSSWEVKYFTMRILFIMTALVNSTVLSSIRDELNGLTSVLNYLEILAEQVEPFDDGTVDVSCEMLKVIYNLFYTAVPDKVGIDSDSDAVNEKYMKNLTTATRLVKLFLFHELKSEEKRDELQSHSIDVLAVIPFEFFTALIPPTDESNYSYDGYEMGVVEEIVEFLYRRLDTKPRERKGTMIDTIAPVLCVLVRMAARIRPIRKYLKLRVLPPLTKSDVLERPEVGTTLRNKLCAHMTSSTSPVTELTCNFLFILVKQNVRRLVKYTGFGNAAGLLANRGLLGGEKSTTGEAYSSESEDSDTSEYKEVSHLINGFGWIEPERPPPCEGMTDEQKEVEAMKLINAIDKLNRNQLIQPVHIGSDGRPHPIDHVCQLLDHSTLGAESLNQSNQSHQNDFSDSE